MGSADTPTVEELRKRLGRHGMIEFGGLRIAVRIDDARVRFGRVDYFVRPIHGEGAVWVEEHRFHENETDA